MSAEIKVLEVSVEKLDDQPEGLQDQNWVSINGKSRVELNGIEHAVTFMVCTSNVFTGYPLDQQTGIHVFLTDHRGDGDNPDLPQAIHECKCEIEGALQEVEAVHTAMRNIEVARDQILETQDEN